LGGVIKARRAEAGTILGEGQLALSPPANVAQHRFDLIIVDNRVIISVIITKVYSITRNFLLALSPPQGFGERCKLLQRDPDIHNRGQQSYHKCYYHEPFSLPGF